MSFESKQLISAQETVKQSGAVGACWAHNPEVDGSKPSSATDFFSFFFFSFPLLLFRDISSSHYHSNKVLFHVGNT